MCCGNVRPDLESRMTRDGLAKILNRGELPGKSAGPENCLSDTSGCLTTALPSTSLRSSRRQRSRMLAVNPAIPLSSSGRMDPRSRPFVAAPQATPILVARHQAPELKVGGALAQLQVRAHVHESIHDRLDLSAAAARTAGPRAAVITMIDVLVHRQSRVPERVD